MTQARTKTIAALLAVVLVVGAIAAGISVLASGGDDAPAPTSGESTDGSTGDGESADAAEQVDAPYAAAACPDPLPNPAQAGLELPPLDRVVAVRLCGEDASEVPADALVEGVGAFARAIEDLPAADTDLCAAAGGGAPTTVLVMETTDGRQVDVRTGVCAGILSGTRTVSGVGLVSTFLEALDGQRQQGTYEPPAAATEAELTCEAPAATAPVVPGREQITEAALCSSPDASPEALEGAALDDLTSAWDEAPEPKAGACDLTAGEGAGYVALRTDLGDVVHLSPGCDGLVLASADLGVNDDDAIDLAVPLTSVVPVRLADLGG
ncbi:hypothetical protein [uncultured Nocardioides sp.]|uniref:hypothetical protein n=1 Tax=uncultured Nocardioides sp. TaxID=198441 RepID=UPI0026296D75|nr:hypothetical protein [uncultured Nocardioides sp.]